MGNTCKSRRDTEKNNSAEKKATNVPCQGSGKAVVDLAGRHLPDFDGRIVLCRSFHPSFLFRFYHFSFFLACTGGGNFKFTSNLRRGLLRLCFHLDFFIVHFQGFHAGVLHFFSFLCFLLLLCRAFFLCLWKKILSVNGLHGGSPVKGVSSAAEQTSLFRFDLASFQQRASLELSGRHSLVSFL